MKIESEKTLERLLKSLVEVHLNGLCLKILPFNFAGLPDRLCLFPGAKILFAEIKTTKKSPTRLQQIVHRKISSLGFRVEVLDTTEKIRKTLEDYGL